MKTKLLTLLFIILAFIANAQIESTYLHYSFEPHDVDITSLSSEYFEGETWFFQICPWYVRYGPLSIEDDGHINGWKERYKLDTYYPYGEIYFERINTVVYNDHIYLFYYPDLQFNKDDDLYRDAYDDLNYFRIDANGNHHHHHIDLDIAPNHENKMASVVVNDTLYLFFTEKHHGHVQYIKGLADTNSSEINWLSNSPTTINDSTGAPLVSRGNVDVITYFTDDNKEIILFAYPSEKTSDTQNDIIYYTGCGDDFLFHHKKTTTGSKNDDISAYFVSLIQGTVKGAQTKEYMVQTIYVTKGEDYKSDRVTKCRMFRNEFNPFATSFGGGWEELPEWTGIGVHMAPELAEYYVPDDNTKELRKYMYAIYHQYWYTPNYVLQWDSDKLKLIGNVIDTIPDSFKKEFWNLICVVEGPPPYVLNGWTMHELASGNKYPPSSFIYGQETTHTVGSNTTYTKTSDWKAGFGPINGGFKRSMSHNNHNSDTDITRLSVKDVIKPPLASAQAEGEMWFYYDGPSLERAQWRLHDYNGDTLDVERSLFLFSFVNPQLIIKKRPFTDFSRSPKLNDINSYVGRNVEYFPGLSSMYITVLLEDIGGGNAETQTIQFDTLYSNTTEKTKTVKLGIDAKYEIFSLQANSTVDVTFTSENNTENLHGFDLTYNNPAPKIYPDTTNILKYNTVAYLMTITDSTAYFLPGGFKESNPLFFTWEVNSIIHGEFLESVNEYSVNIDKYEFSNYPNPCNNQSTFAYVLSNRSFVNLSVYNAYGQKVYPPINEVQDVGNHQINLQTLRLPNGIYYYRLLINQDLIMGKFIKN